MSYRSHRHKLRTCRSNRKTATHHFLNALYDWCGGGLADLPRFHGKKYELPLPVPCRTRCPSATKRRKCSLSVLRLAPMSRIISPIVARPCCGVWSKMRAESSGKGASISFSRSTLARRRRVCWASARRKKSSQGPQSGEDVRMVPCVWRSAR